MQYLNEFFLLAIAIQMALISLELDFMIILKQTISQGTKYTYYSSLGIYFGITIHVVYTFLTLGMILKFFHIF